MAIQERELDDADLVSAAQEGDSEAFAELFRRHYGAVRRICARRLGSLVEADEVAQAAFVRAFERIHQCGGERRFGAWVQVIAYRVGADSRRSQARALPSDEPVSGDAALGPNSCEDALLRAERVAEVRQMLETLPPRQREVIIARDLEGRRPGEIAASLGLSLGAVDSLLLRARRRMASAWQAAGVEHGAASMQVTTASLAATTVARPQAVGRVLATVGNAIDRLSVRVANALGLTAGGSPAAPSIGRLAVAAAALAAPAIGLSAARPAAPHSARHSPAVTKLLPLSTPSGATVPATPASPPALQPAAAVPQLEHSLTSVAAVPNVGGAAKPSEVAGVGTVADTAAGLVGSTVATLSSTVSSVSPATGALVQKAGVAVGTLTHTTGSVLNTLTAGRATPAS
jgi:RNA polymerase sigma-70 factor (ECF subfamily)